MHLPIRFVVRRLDPYFSRSHVVVQMVIATAIGAGLGAWVTFGIPDVPHPFLALPLGAASGFGAGIFLVFRDRSKQKTSTLNASRKAPPPLPKSSPPVAKLPDRLR